MTRRKKVALWLSIPGFLVFSFLCLVPGLEWIPELIVRLFSGWVYHAQATLPHVTVSWSGVGMMAVCVGLAGFVGHRFFRWLWEGTGHTDPWQPRWTIAGLGVVLLMFGAGMAVTAVAHQTGWLMRSPYPMARSSWQDRYAPSDLKTIASAQADFRANDRDNNRINDYWRDDIAGLFAFQPEGAPDCLKLIELSLATADPARKTESRWFDKAKPRSGYWFKALRYSDEDKELNRTGRFAACAYPDNPVAGHLMYLITEANIMYRKECPDFKPPDLCPDDPLKDGWTKLD